MRFRNPFSIGFACLLCIALPSSISAADKKKAAAPESDKPSYELPQPAKENIDYTMYQRIRDEGLTISTNLFGTTYYSLVGLHGFHVTVGLLALTIVAIFYFASSLRREHSERLEILSMYWHFVDAVWVAVFLVVYVIGV